MATKAKKTTKAKKMRDLAPKRGARKIKGGAKNNTIGGSARGD